MRSVGVRRLLVIGLVIILACLNLCAMAEDNGGITNGSGEIITETTDDVDFTKIREEIDESWASTVTTFALMSVAAFVVITVGGIVLLRKQKHKYEIVISSLRRQMTGIKSEADAKIRAEKAMNDAHIYSIKQNNARDLKGAMLSNEKTIRELKETIETLQKGVDLYREQYRRATVLHPNLEEEINRMLVRENEERNIERAKAFDVAAGEFDGRSATRHMVDSLKKTLNMYTMLSPAQKNLVKADVNRIKRMLEEAITFEKKYEQEKVKEQQMQSAKEASEQIQRMIGGMKVGIATDYDRLVRAKKIYDRLDNESAKFVNQPLLDRLTRLLCEAKRDKFGAFYPRNI